MLSPCERRGTFRGRSPKRSPLRICRSFHPSRLCVLRRLVCEHHGAGIERPCSHELHGSSVALTEEALPATYDDGEDHQPIFVYEVLGHQALYQLTAPEDQDVFAFLLLAPCDLFCEIALDQAGVSPSQGFFQG